MSLYLLFNCLLRFLSCKILSKYGAVKSSGGGDFQGGKGRKVNERRGIIYLSIFKMSKLLKMVYSKFTCRVADPKYFN